MKKHKKRTIIELAVLIVLIMMGLWYLFLGGEITEATDEVIPGEKDTNVLVVYFSREGVIPDGMDAVASASPNSNRLEAESDTETAAKMIQQLTGADLFQIRTKRYYRTSFWGTAATAWVEETLNLRPGLAAKPESLDKYDVIYVGYPIWWFNAPMAVGTFLESYDLTGKTIIPFCTSTDNGIDVSMDFIREVSGNAMVLEGYRIHDSGLEDVSAWLERIGVLEQTDGQEDTDFSSESGEKGYVTEGTEIYRGFVVDNVFHSVNEGDVHLFAFEAQKYNPQMIVVAPQLNDWGETSADQTICLVEYFLQQYNIDKSKVYGNGYSGGGETMSIVMGKRPDLFTAYLHVSSQWDGAYESVAEQRLPVYFAIGSSDEYYGSEPTQRAYDILHVLYEEQGLSDDEIDKLLVLDIKEHDYFTERNVSNEHGGGSLFAYDEEIMGWLFSK